MPLLHFQEELKKLVTQNGRPVVVFAAIWPCARALNVSPKELPSLLLDLFTTLIDTTKRDLIMPTFAKGYENGLCNLDLTPSTTGILSENFRQDPTSHRSLSAFFSFNIKGPNAVEFSNLKPLDAWGDGSTYQWMENQNANFLMLGTHPTHCSYLHRLEWLCRESIFYRYRKPFHGTIIRNKQDVIMEETLFVRDPLFFNDFTPLNNPLINGGMISSLVNGLHLSWVDTKTIRNVCVPLITQDPYIILKKESTNA